MLPNAGTELEKVNMRKKMFKVLNVLTDTVQIKGYELILYLVFLSRVLPNKGF